MSKIDKKEFLVLNVDDNNVSLYFPDIAKKVKKFSVANKEYYDLFVKKCQLTKRKILYYQENQDQDMITNYLTGCVNFKTKFSNIKDYFLINKYFKFASKDNLCFGLGIDKNLGLKSEWTIFEKINGHFCYCENKDEEGLCVLYSLTEQYYFSVSRVNSYLNIDRVINLPNLVITSEEIFAFDLPAKKLLVNFQPQKDFAQDDGIIFEAMIAKSLNAKEVKDWKFLCNNKKKLIKLGQFSYEPKKKDEKYRAEVKKVATKVKTKIKKLITFIKKNIFQLQEIKTQELIVNEQLKIFGNTDFSNEHAVLEMKFVQNYAKINDINKVNDYINRYKYQLYVTARERPVYLLIGSYEKFLVLRVKFKII